MESWNGWVDDDDFLDFVYPRNKTIAYSVSLGKADTSKYDPKWVANRKKDITQFNHVSMRRFFCTNYERYFSRRSYSGFGSNLSC